MSTASGVPAIRNLPQSSRRAILIGSAGNLVENFSGASFSYLAPLFAHQFFPMHTPSIALLLTLATYATGFLTKPVGAYIFGTYGDRAGRRNSLYLSILLMAVSSLIVTVVPGYSYIGFAAPMLLVVARLLEGISSGGEFGISAAYLIEFAPARRRAFVGSLQQVTVVAGVLLGSAVVALLENAVPSGPLHAWVWRLPFALGTILCLVCAVLRYRVADTPVFEQVKDASGQAAHPVWEVLRDYPKASLRVAGLSMAGITVYYVWLKFLPSYAHASIGIGLATAQAVNVVALVITIPLIPLFSLLADHYGRRPTLLIFGIGMGVAAYPLLLALRAGTAGFAFAQVGGAVLLSFGMAAAPAAKAELFPARVRAAGISFPYSIAAVVFGGSAPLLTLSFANSAHPMLLGAYISAVCLAGSLVYFSMPETKDRPLDDQTATRQVPEVTETKT
ncbi:MAG TPA: MFS transporter [Pseudonocardiaceae bacterium]|nr:MFS transporter [Pseudonocardiaceae bacterium]